jgi:hypothetical protein
MDTLCIPVKHEHKDLRDASIAIMASIYQGATGVLVLDAEISSVTLNGLTEAIAHILLSVWMCRIWTLQEAALARSCIFAFANNSMLKATPYRKDDFVSWYIIGQDTIPDVDVAESSIRASLEAHYFRFVTSIVPVTVEDWMLDTAVWPTDGQYLAAVWNALAGRTTSKADDLWAVLANLLRLNTNSLLPSEPSGTKLARVLLTLKMLPVSLFLADVERQFALSHSMNRWIPARIGRSLLSGKENCKIQTSRSKLSWCFHSRYSQYCVYVTKSPVPTDTQQLVIEDEDQSVHYHARLDPDMNDMFQPSTYLRTCFVLPSKDLGESYEPRSAIFYIQHEEQKNIDVVFYKSVAVEQHTGSSLQCQGNSESVYVVTKISECYFNILYGMFSIHTCING